MIIFDFIGHMVSTESEEELHLFAAQLGLRREWYQEPSRGAAITKESPHYGRHYDLTTPNAMRRARRAGAVEVTPSELVREVWWSTLSKNEPTAEPAAMAEPVATAEFLGWQPDVSGKPPVAMYNIIGGKRHGSTVSLRTLKAEGIEIK